jgi:UDPglucose 6-dehydrogenase
LKVAVIGTGHVGLVTSVTLAAIGHEVAAMDVDEDKVDAARRGQPPFYEPGLETLLAEQLDRGTLRFGASSREILPAAEVVFVCVGTGTNAGGDADLVAVEQAAVEIAHHATGSVVVVEKSTVPAGTAEQVRSTLVRRRPDIEFHVVSNPEFMREGSAVRDSLEPHRILVGSDDPRGFEAMRELYAPILARGTRLIETGIRTAELAKHACNAFLALKISYANALSRICELADADVTAVTEVMGSDPRIGPAFLHAGLGYGGFCFPKDLVAFGHLSSKLGYDFPLLREIARINAEAVDAAIEKVRQAVWNVEGKQIAVLGLSFKPDTDDVRFSPALTLARRLVDLGADVVGFDPEAADAAKAEVPQMRIAVDPYEAARDADVLVLATDWDQFRDLDLAKIRQLMAFPNVVDGRNFFDPDGMVAEGFTYYPMGRQPMTPANA